MNKKKWLSTPYLVWMIAFTIIPLLLIGYYGFTGRDGSFTIENITAIFSPAHSKALLKSLYLSLLCTIVCLILAYPVALILKNKNVGQGGFVIMIFILPMWMNFLLRTYAWLNLLDDGGIIERFCESIGISYTSIIGTDIDIILGMVYNFLPFMILPLFNVLTKMDQHVINAASDLGANAFQTFTKVVLPLSLPGIVSGVTMVFVPSLTTFVISDLLGARKVMLIGNIIEQEFSIADNRHLGSGLSLVLMIFILASMALIHRYDKNGEGSSL